MTKKLNKYKDWCFTQNKDEEPKWNEEKMKYLIYQLEQAPTTGKLHYQGFVQLKTRTYLTGVKKLFPGANLRRRKGSVKQAMNYCRKAESRITMPKEYGKVTGQGKRTDIERFKEAIDRGCTQAVIANDYFMQWCKYGHLIQKYRKLQAETYLARFPIESFNKPALDLRTHWLLYGPPDTGKTQYALAHFKKPLYVRHIDTLGCYDDHDGIVIDEMSFTHWPINSVIGLLNKKDPLQIHIRYVVAYIPPGIPMIFTSNEKHIFWDPTKPPGLDSIASIKAKCKICNVLNKLF